MQRRGTKKIKWLEHHSYKERLKSLKLFNLEKRQLEEGVLIIEVYKIMDREHLFSLSQNTRAWRMCLVKLMGNRLRTENTAY